MEQCFRQIHVLTVRFHVAKDEEPDLLGGVGYLLQVLLHILQHEVHKGGQDVVQNVTLAAKVVVHAAFAYLCRRRDILHARFDIAFRTKELGRSRGYRQDLLV